MIGETAPRCLGNRGTLMSMRCSPLPSGRARSPNVRPRKRVRHTRDQSSPEGSRSETEAVPPANALPSCATSAVCANADAESISRIFPAITGESTVPTIASPLPQMRQVDCGLVSTSGSGARREPIPVAAQRLTESGANLPEASLRVVSESASLPESVIGHTSVTAVADDSHLAVDVPSTITASRGLERLPSEFTIAMPIIACPDDVLSPVVAESTALHDSHLPVVASCQSVSNSSVAQASPRSASAVRSAAEVKSTWHLSAQRCIHSIQ